VFFCIFDENQTALFMKNFCFLALILTVLCSCENERENENYPATAELSNTAFHITSEVKLYSKYGRITDQRAINQWKANYSGNEFIDYFYWDNSFLALPYVDSDIKILENTKLIKDRDTLLLKETREDYKIFRPRDTTYSYLSYIQEDLSKFIKNIGFLKNYESPVFYDSNLFKVYRGRIVKGNTNRLEVPYAIVACTYRNVNTGAIEASSYKFVNNNFDPAVINTLRLGDTLAIQEATAVYESQEDNTYKKIKGRTYKTCSTAF